MVGNVTADEACTSCDEDFFMTRVWFYNGGLGGAVVS
jgi:hypothetical protein